ncbi:glycoside hydrolase family 2 protein [Gilvimarinus algae]|uniref:Glycoside hydrolase family 2 TIM barrel-domain containing protein n=1 Tax=Gilvimarinus algae TaxID=3058037 RepID=A0ABT8THY9_9GAMM|nr:sugar-binding domain-containing protein [Gilvimarinus sp. SDUM040014]MDO3383719.1 glycoside hydrolase family 2 TIM barrel-domain containing protein [Gilvimarinus sp. SDUM040014]
MSTKNLWLILAALSLTSVLVKAADPGQGAGMMTRWGEQVNADNAWQEYPRPQLRREQWHNLNGRWDLAIVDRKSAEPKSWDQKILVPFSVESPLSGIGERVEDLSAIWYRRHFEYALQAGKRHLLHFEAVDYATKVWVNDIFVGAHMGGNLPFSFDVTDALKNGDNEVVVRVIDDTDAADRYQLRGKQTRNNQGIWYTPVSGIWQTVWLESTGSTYIESLRNQATNTGELTVNASIAGDKQDTLLEVTISKNGKKLATKAGSGNRVELALDNPELWSPQSPELYDLELVLKSASGDVLDRAESYVGFRSVGRIANEQGNVQFTLNGEPIFHWGPLDQGWWPDGLLTPPSDEAVVFEMKYLKASGFNMIRKHKKVEPRRYYYHADRLGFLVWQDQVSGGADTDGGKQEWPVWHHVSQPYEDRMQGEIDAPWPAWAHNQYMRELTVMIDTLYNHPSIVVWTTFNERWGQHNSLQVGRFVESYDTTRHLNIASGGNFFPVGDIADAHHYPEPKFLMDAAEFDGYIKVIGEFGGHGWPVEGHIWAPEREKMIYGNMPASLGEYKARYENSIRGLGDYKKRGVAAGVYTQTTDVETEINGLLTYDRAVEKIPAGELRQLHEKYGLTTP